MNIKESRFVWGLNRLVETLDQRESQGLCQFIESEGTRLLREIAEQIDESNLEEMFVKCGQVIATLGEVRYGPMVDDLENLEALVYHMGTVYQNPLRSENQAQIELNKILWEKIHLFQNKAQALASYLGRY